MPGNRIEVLPAAAGRLLVKVTENGTFSVTMIVGPGTCIVPPHTPVAGGEMAVGTARPLVALQA